MFAKDLPESVIKRLSIRVKELAGINLGQGIPSFPTPIHIRNAAKKALDERDIGVYPNFLGQIELRQAIVEKINRKHALSLTAEDNVLVTVGAMEGAAASILSILDTGDQAGVITPDYCNHFPEIQLAKGKVVEIPMEEANEWRLNFDRIEEAACRGLQLLVLTNPNNPTGCVYDRIQIGQLVKMSNQYGFWVLADETYAFLDYEKKFTSLLEFWDKNERLIVVRTFSKEYAMTGWRVGYVIASPEAIRVLAKTHDALVGCTPKISQRAALAALTGPQIIVSEFVKVLVRRRELVIQELGKFNEFVSSNKPHGAYYVFPKYKLKINSSELCERILEEAKVAVVPGSVFGKAGEGHLRISFAVDDQVLVEGVKKLKTFFENYS